MVWLKSLEAFGTEGDEFILDTLEDACATILEVDGITNVTHEKAIEFAKRNIKDTDHNYKKVKIMGWILHIMKEEE